MCDDYRDIFSLRSFLYYGKSYRYKRTQRLISENYIRNLYSPVLSNKEGVVFRGFEKRLIPYT